MKLLRPILTTLIGWCLLCLALILGGALAHAAWFLLQLGWSTANLLLAL